MPPKKTAPTVTKTQVNGVSKTTVKKTATKAADPKAVKQTTKTATKASKATVGATTKTSTTTSTSRKRKITQEEDTEPEADDTVSKRLRHVSLSPSVESIKKPAKAVGDARKSRPVKPTSTLKVTAAKKPKTTKPKEVINHAPTNVLDVYTFGGGESGELGFAGAKGTKEIKRPRINPYLGPDKAGVVQFSVGGMHTAALTHDNKILTWGVNDQGALGRNTNWDGGLADMKEADADDDDSDSDEGEINPHESTPGEVDFSALPNKPIFTQVCATDSATFALTEDGTVYGWGTFRSNEGIFGFSKQTQIQQTPIEVENLSKITKLAAGANHVLAMDNKGKVFSWGAGQQDQLGRRILERHQMNSLLPAKFGLRGTMVNIGAGAYHSFAVSSTGKVHSWGLNSFGQTGGSIDMEEGSGGVHLPIEIKAFTSGDHGKVIHITGGAQHSVAVTDKGEALAWGRLDGFQVGIDISKLPEEHVIKDASNRPRILTVPTQIPDIDAVTAGAGSDHSIVVSKDGKAYSFGFNEYGQAGVGGTDDVETATLIDNTAVRGKQLVAVDCGGQFSVLGSTYTQTNGVADHA